MTRAASSDTSNGNTASLVNDFKKFFRAALLLTPFIIGVACEFRTRAAYFRSEMPRKIMHSWRIKVINRGATAARQNNRGPAKKPTHQL